jgi:16S rRNA (guanine527-N7)-methyltransferase
VNSAAIESAIRGTGLKGLSPEALSQFELYLELLLKWNSRLNLTGIREPEAIIRRHFLECIQCAQALPEAPTLLDFGSGAGLPGIPIAICHPEINVTMGESQRKKAGFLREVVRSLNLLNAEVFDGRIEEMPLETQFSIVTLRAVDKMTEACRSALARIAPSGWIILFATSATESDLKSALPEITWSQKLPIPNLDQGEILLGQRRS